MTDDIKELQELAKYYQNCAEYYPEKATWWRKQLDFSGIQDKRY